MPTPKRRQTFSPRTASWIDNPRGVVSLRDLLAYAADIFCLLADVLGRVQAQPFGLFHAATGNQGYRQDFLVKLVDARELCVKHGWMETAHQISQVGEYLDEPNMMPLVLQSKCADLERHLFRVLEDNLFFHANKDCLQEWHKSVDLSKVWKRSFPFASIEMSSARNCYLYEESAASVFHSMRALEIGLTAFAQELHVPINRDQWEVIVNNIESEIKKINGPHAGSDWKRKQQQYSEAALHFRYLKNAWRNHVMHVRHIYEPPKALQILGHVSEFVQALKDIGLKEPNADKFFET